MIARARATETGLSILRDGAMTDTARELSHQARAGRWLLVAAVAGAALAVGTVHTITLCVVTVALAAASILTWWGTEPKRFRPRPAAALLLVTGFVLTSYTAFQCVPLPIGSRIAPHNADVWSRALTPLREAGPSWAPISLDPIATRRSAQGGRLPTAFVTALRIAQRRGKAAFLSVALILTGAALAAASLPRLRSPQALRRLRAFERHVGARQARGPISKPEQSRLVPERRFLSRAGSNPFA